MIRREILTAGTVGALLGTGGCIGGVGSLGDDSDNVPGCTQREEWPDDITSGPPDPNSESIAGRRHCATANRPEPTGDVCETFDGPGGLLHSAGVEPYPDPPSTFDEETLISFVYEYERAYTQNAKVVHYRERVTGVGIGIKEDKTRVLDTDDGYTVIYIQFTLSISNFDEEYGPSVGDSAGAAVYGVDETGIVRSETDYGKIDENTLEEMPDPVEDGTLLECF